MNHTYDSIETLRQLIGNRIDIDFTLWLTWLMMPLLICLVGPVLIAFILYLNVIILYILKWHWRLLRASIESENYRQFGRLVVAAIWDAHGWLFHAHEITGLEHIPASEDSAALIVYYHGAIPIDLYYLMAKVMLQKNRLVHTVADRFLFRIPGWQTLSETLKIIPGTVQSCADVLRSGNLLAIAPGGVYEAQFSANYTLLWKSRLGFAKVALQAEVPIIPMFTENVRESFRTFCPFPKLWLQLYAWTKFPCAPVFGGFPVKLRTHLGTPIPYDPNLTAEQLQQKVAAALQSLIAKHQTIPGRIHDALLQRIPLYRRFKNKQQ